MFNEQVERVVKAVHGKRQRDPDPDYIAEMAEDLRRQYGPEGLTELYGRFIVGSGTFDTTMRRILWHALAKSCGCGLQVEAGAGFKHPETFEIGHGVFVGSQAYIQGRYDGNCRIGNHVWIGPQSYFDARDLVLEDYVGWGPGARVLGSTHTGLPVHIPIIETNLVIKPVRVCKWADIGTSAVLLPGVTVGESAIVGAGAVVIRDVPPYAKAAGVPATVIGWRQQGEEIPTRARD